MNTNWCDFCGEPYTTGAWMSYIEEIQNNYCTEKCKINYIKLYYKQKRHHELMSILKIILDNVKT